MKPEKLAKKNAYFAQLIENFQTYPDVLIVHADYVGSKQMQNIRIQLRGKAIVLMGKNTMIRTAMRQKKDEFPELGLDKVLPHVKGNIGFIFCISSIEEIREVIANNSVPAAAKAGVIAGCDVQIPAGPCGLDPSATTFFQALNIATKIVKGSIELLSSCQVLTKGAKVSLSQQVLLQKLNIKPFEYSLVVLSVYQSGSVFDAAVLDITDDILLGKWAAGVANVAALSREIGIPTAPAVPHIISGAFKNIAALVAEIDFTFKEVETVKAFIADPSAFACAAPAAGGAAAAAPAAAAVVEEEEEEEDMDFDLFG
jgi:large subunit ribosomal protein LP0